MTSRISPQKSLNSWSLTGFPRILLAALRGNQSDALAQLRAASLSDATIDDLRSVRSLRDVRAHRASFMSQA